MGGRLKWRANRLIFFVTVATVITGCGGVESSLPEAPSTASTVALLADTTIPATMDSAAEEVPEAEPVSVVLSGSVISDVDGTPLAGVTVAAGQSSMTTGSDGRFEIKTQLDATVTATRPAWMTTSLPVDGSMGVAANLTIELTPFTVRGLRVASDVVADPDRFDQLLAMADRSVVNTLVFDTKDEDDRVLYQSNVALAQSMGAVDPLYDPAEVLAKARHHDLYTVTRIVTFEDGLWANSVPEARLALDWVDAGNRNNWEYPLNLAVEACQLGFDEIQFDYVRYPEGRSAKLARELGVVPTTSDERAAVISAFLSEARDRLAPAGCAVSAAIFGVVMSGPGDQGIGQTVEAVSASVDAVSPMIYPSHYGPGWLGLDEPNEHPGQVVAHALDGGIPRLAPNTMMRPWFQAFFYNEDQVKAQINEAEQRGSGWILWNFYGRYRQQWLPTGDEQ